MFDPESLAQLRKAIHERTEADRGVLDAVLQDVRALAPDVRAIKPRSTTAVSLVASDGGSNRLVFDPFYIQVVRVVDSYGKQLCLDAVSPTTDPGMLSKRQFSADGSPSTALGRMMRDLGVTELADLSHMVPRRPATGERAVSPAWTLVYRDLCEWAVLYERICHQSFATDTLFVRDGLLRSKLFRGELFIELRRRLERAANRIYEQDRRRVYIAGLAKSSKVLARYNLAMAVEQTLPPGEARYVRVPREMEEKAYEWPEYARGQEAEGEGEAPKFVAGDMYFARFGTRSSDPIWVVDIFSPQSRYAPEIFGYLLADAIDGFPVPYYPMCLQRAHEHAQVVDFDLDILQDQVYEAIRALLPPTRDDVVDAIRLGVDFAGRRYQ